MVSSHSDTGSESHAVRTVELPATRDLNLAITDVIRL
jgi:hypothetical protein